MTAKATSYDYSPNFSVFKRAHPFSTETIKKIHVIDCNTFPKRNEPIETRIQQHPYADSVSVLIHFENLRDLYHSSAAGTKVRTI